MLTLKDVRGRLFTHRVIYTYIVRVETFDSKFWNSESMIRYTRWGLSQDSVKIQWTARNKPVSGRRWQTSSRNLGWYTENRTHHGQPAKLPGCRYVICYKTRYERRSIYYIWTFYLYLYLYSYVHLSPL